MKIKHNDIPAGWFMAAHPSLDENTQGYYWAWVVRDRLDVCDEIVTVREPEIVRVCCDVEGSDPVICRTDPRGGMDSGSYRGLPENRVLWKGPLDY